MIIIKFDTAHQNECLALHCANVPLFQIMLMYKLCYEGFICYIYKIHVGVMFLAICWSAMHLVNK